MGLRKKILLGLFATCLGLMTFVYFVPARIFLGSFRQMEIEDLNEKVVQVQEVVHTQLETLNVKAADWAAWDDTYRYVKDRNPAYAKSNLNPETISNLKIDFMILLNEKLNPVTMIHINLSTGKFAPFPKALKDILESKPEFLSHGDLNSTSVGILELPKAPVILASRPILTSRQTGPIHGTLIFGRYLDSNIIESMRRVTHLNLRFLSAKSSEAMNIINSFHELQAENSFAHQIPSEDEIKAYTVIRGIDGTPALLAELDEARTIYQEGKAALSFSTASLLIACLIFGLSSLWFLQSQIISRLTELSTKVRRIGEEGDLSVRLLDHAKDELSDLSRSINYMLGLIEDSQTEVRDTTQLLRESNDRLTAKVLEAQRLNQELKNTQQQLLQSQKLDSIGRLAGGIAHDFNNLLGSILGYATLLERSTEKHPELKKPVDVIRRSAERASDLTKQLLGFARIGSYEKKTVDLNQSVIEAAKMLERSIPKNITVRTELTKPLYTTDADSTQILQVLMNLAINARDAMPKGGTLLIQTENVDVDAAISKTQSGLRPGKFARIRVSDTGSGMTKDIQARIFDPFFTTKEVGAGSGLGLAMVYGIMQSHQGRVAVYSEPNVGTVFTLYFPASKTVSLKLEAHGVTEDLMLSPNLLKNRVILLVDDEPLMLDTSKEILESSGAEVITAKSGIDALEIFSAKRDSIDLVLTDIVMPKMNGLQLARAIRETDPSIPLILSSGYTENSEILALRSDPLIGFIQKPYRSDALISLIWKSLKEKPSYEKAL